MLRREAVVEIPQDGAKNDEGRSYKNTSAKKSFAVVAAIIASY
jgi:hypothetical protein